MRIQEKDKLIKFLNDKSINFILDYIKNNYSIYKNDNYKILDKSVKLFIINTNNNDKIYLKIYNNTKKIIF